MGSERDPTRAPNPPSPPARLPSHVQEESVYWGPWLLRLCLDDSVGVRAEALKAARRAVECLGSCRGMASWVLRVLDDGSLYASLERFVRRWEARGRETLVARLPPRQRGYHRPSIPSSGLA